MKQISFTETVISDGFWKKKLDMVSEVSIYNILKRFRETGRFDAIKCKWKQGDDFEPHIFWDSDVAKWIESAAFLMESKSYPELEEIIDEVADDIEKNADEKGYFNSCYLVHSKPRWSDRTDHELYCAGHMIEAAAAYYRATGKRKLLDLMEKYLEYINETFIVNNQASFITPGHEEIELALIKLYRLTENRKYLDMCRFFIDMRGKTDEQEYKGVRHEYSQSHLPVREQTTAEGHCVRACYLYCAMADVAAETNDKELYDACRVILEDIITKKMYITGGIGSSARGEAFTIPYDLPDLTAYSESCAALSLAWFAHRMLQLDADSVYADTVERVLYNNALSSVSLDGKSFFYVNPLAIRTHLLHRHECQENTRDSLPETQRKEVFDCSCCPPNITRFITSVADFIYTENEDTLFVHQYINSKTCHNGFSVFQKTAFPDDGNITIKTQNVKNIAVRIPGWCNGYVLKLNGKEITPDVRKGYAYVSLTDSENTLGLSFETEPFVVYPSSNVRDYLGRAAIQRGPVVYCAEGKDNEKLSVMSFIMDTEAPISQHYDENLGAYVLEVSGSIPAVSDELYSRKKAERCSATIKMIPYYAFANNGETDMEIFMQYL